MKRKQLAKLGVPHGAMDQAMDAVATAERAGMTPVTLHNRLCELLTDPSAQTADPVFGAMARAVISAREARTTYKEREAPAKYARWGSEIEPTALEQMDNA